MTVDVGTSRLGRPPARPITSEVVVPRSRNYTIAAALAGLLRCPTRSSLWRCSRKLQIADRAQAIVIAREAGIEKP
jgi:hypothetical protein